MWVSARTSHHVLAVNHPRDSQNATSGDRRHHAQPATSRRRLSIVYDQLVRTLGDIERPGTRPVPEAPRPPGTGGARQGSPIHVSSTATKMVSGPPDRQWWMPRLCHGPPIERRRAANPHVCRSTTGDPRAANAFNVPTVPPGARQHDEAGRSSGVGHGRSSRSYAHCG